MSKCFVPLRNLNRIHSPRALKLQDVEVKATGMERYTDASTCRQGVLVSEGVLGGPWCAGRPLPCCLWFEKKKQNNDIRKVVPDAKFFSVILLTALELFVGNSKKKWFHPQMQTCSCSQQLSYKKKKRKTLKWHFIHFAMLMFLLCNWRHTGMGL